MNVHRVISYFLIAIFISACTTVQHAPEDNFASRSFLKPGLLLSERIREKFGSFFVQVLLQDELSGVRLSSMYTEDAGTKHVQAIAMTAFNLNVDPRLQKAHKEIFDGASIGSTLVKHGFSVEKDLLFSGLSEPMPENVSHTLRTDSNQFASSVYDLNVKIGNESVYYCTITEIYAPEFLALDELNFLTNNANNNKTAGSVHEKISEYVESSKVSNNFLLLRAALATL